jgi:uncharacterized protein YutE (UPF0331/DUF86 family)
MVAGIRALPLDDFPSFAGDRHQVAAAESHLRRAIEALVDLGRHILAKRFAVAVSEHRSIPKALAEVGVLEGASVATFMEICGYRNRLVHFYHLLSDEELYEICAGQLEDLELILGLLLDWVQANPDP